MTYPIAYATPKRRMELRSMPYSEYLRTPEWRQVRWVALNEAGHRCRLCPSIDNLEVHHPHGYECRGAETPADVVVLCDACHGREHVTRAPVVDAAAVPRRQSTPEEAELDAMRCEILRLRGVGDHDAADLLTRQREQRWRQIGRVA